MPSAKPWEFWVDVGGTFTDCLAQGPDGRLLRHKLLSSGATKGSVGAGSSAHCLVDEHRQCDPNDFWVGFRATLLDTAGEVIAVTSVESFDNNLGALQLADPIPLKRVAAYELSCDLEAPVLGIRYLLELPLAQMVPPLRLRLGTTRGTNALLTRTGARTALATTRGFGDLLQIGYQDRPQLFQLTVHKPTPLAERVVEINERMAADGTVLEAPDPISVRRQLEQLRQDGVQSLAICLLHADLYPAHEQLVEKIAAEVGFDEISRSSAVAPLVKIVARGETTVVDAYLNPVLTNYVAALGRLLPGSQLRLMTSAGGLVGAEAFRGHQSLLSGPAGGVIGVAQVAQAAGETDLVTASYGGRAQAYVGLGQWSNAVADAQQVPTDFVFDAFYSDNSSGERNEIFDETHQRYEMSAFLTLAGSQDPPRPPCAIHRLPRQPGLHNGYRRGWHADPFLAPLHHGAQ
ncbi:MAG: hypothetical protein IH898_12350 [Planctomycetes bacterium]|nr:hypothetical protein [Planctomycetota bacterium]